MLLAASAWSGSRVSCSTQPVVCRSHKGEHVLNHSRMSPKFAPWHYGHLFDLQCGFPFQQATPKLVFSIGMQVVKGMSERVFDGDVRKNTRYQSPGLRREMQERFIAQSMYNMHTSHLSLRFGLL